MTAEKAREELIDRLKKLSELLWERRCKDPDIQAWLKNFDGRHSAGDAETEQLHALHLLSHVSYFGLPEIRVLLRAMYRDLFRYPIVQKLRKELGGTKDTEEINRRFTEELRSTRFVGMGNPAESGTHLLYYLRQENKLPKSLFVHQSKSAMELLTPDLRRLVFIDDFCGSGSQAVDYSSETLSALDDMALRSGLKIEYFYFVLFGTVEGLARVRSESRFDIVEAVGELSSTDKAFDSELRIFKRYEGAVTAVASEHLARHYGRELLPDWPLGFDDNQLLLAFHHNTPDNSLPILWFDEGDPAWVPIFPRHPKIG